MLFEKFEFHKLRYSNQLDEGSLMVSEKSFKSYEKQLFRFRLKITLKTKLKMVEDKIVPVWEFMTQVNSLI